MMPARGAVRVYCIFIASMTTTGSPAETEGDKGSKLVDDSIAALKKQLN